MIATRTEKIAQAVEVMETEEGDVYVNVCGTVLNLNTTDFEGTVQIMSEVHAGGFQYNYGSDPLYYVKGVTPLSEFEQAYALNNSAGIK